MKRKLISAVAIFITAVVLLTSCQTGPTTQVSSDIVSSDIVSSDTVSSDTVSSVSEDVSSEESQEQAAEYFLNAVALEEYSIVYANDLYGYSRDVAIQFKQELKEITGISLNLEEDTKGESEYEIIIGDTNRDANLTADTLGSLEYGYVAEGNKVIFNAGAPYLLELTAEEILKLYSMEKNLAISSEPRKFQFEFAEPESVILIIGDGMGENHIRYAVENGLDVWIGDIMTNKGKSTTNSFTGTTDSAAAATALSTGYKTKNGSVGVDRNGNPVKVMGELVKEKGKELMIVSNYNIYDATPAGFTAHAVDRALSTVIKEQQANIGALVIQGIPDNTLAGFVNTLSKYDELEEQNGFFFMDEEGYCDAAGHNNEFGYCVDAVTRIDKLTRYAISYILHHPDTVLIVTADHETGGIVKDEQTGEWKFTSTNHTGVPVPVYAMGYGTEVFNDNTVDNTEISKFIAAVMGEDDWGDPTIPMTIETP